MAAHVWLPAVPSPCSCQQMPSPSFHHTAKRYRKSHGSVTLPALERFSALTAACRSRPVPVGAMSLFRAAAGSSLHEARRGGGGRAAVWEPGAQMTGEEDMLRTPRSSPSPPAESRDCNRRAGFYYDELLKKCINCTTVCGQHPRQCAPSCESKAARKGRQSGDVGQDSPGLGWKRSQVTGPKLGKGQQTPPLSVLGGCVFVRCHFTGTGEKQSRASASLLFSPSYNSIIQHVFPFASTSQGQDQELHFSPRGAASSPWGGGAGGDGLFSPRSAIPTLGLRRDHGRRGKGGKAGWEGISSASPWKRNTSRGGAYLLSDSFRAECTSASSTFPIKKSIV